MLRVVAIGLVAQSIIIKTFDIYRTMVAQTIPSKSHKTCSHHRHLHQQNTKGNHSSYDLVISINPYQGPLLVRPHVLCGEHPKGFVEVCVHHDQLWLYP